jgi:hypothetical protein
VLIVEVIVREEVWLRGLSDLVEYLVGMSTGEGHAEGEAIMFCSWAGGIVEKNKLL